MRTIECEIGDGLITEDEVLMAVEVGNEAASPGMFHKACEAKIDRERWTPGPTVPFEQAPRCRHGPDIREGPRRAWRRQEAFSADLSDEGRPEPDQDARPGAVSRSLARKYQARPTL